jgi:hypothetical protein
MAAMIKQKEITKERFECDRAKLTSHWLEKTPVRRTMLEMETLVGGVDRSTSKIEIIDDTFVVASSSLYFTLPYNTAFWYFNSWFRVE